MRWFILLVWLSLGVKAWDEDDLEVFDVVEEVGQNFYELMGITRVIFYIDLVLFLNFIYQQFFTSVVLKRLNI